MNVDVDADVQSPNPILSPLAAALIRSALASGAFAGAFVALWIGLEPTTTAEFLPATSLPVLRTVAGAVITSHILSILAAMLVTVAAGWLPVSTTGHGSAGLLLLVVAIGLGLCAPSLGWRGEALATIVVVSAPLGILLGRLMREGAPRGWQRNLRVLLQSTSLAAGLLVLLLVASTPPLGLEVTTVTQKPLPLSFDPSLPGLALVALGAAWCLWCLRFLVAGGGCADPLDPPRRRCVDGPYANQDHPMQWGQFAVVVGAALFINSMGAAGAAVVVVVAMLGPLRFLERGDLRRRFAPSSAPSDDGAT